MGPAEGENSTKDRHDPRSLRGAEAAQLVHDSTDPHREPLVSSDGLHGVIHTAKSLEQLCQTGPEAVFGDRAKSTNRRIAAPTLDLAHVLPAESRALCDLVLGESASLANLAQAPPETALRLLTVTHVAGTPTDRRIFEPTERGRYVRIVSLLVDSPHSRSRKRILLVDDDALVRSALGRSLRDEFEVTPVPNGELAVAILRTTIFDAVVTDYRMGEVTGIDVLETALRSQPLCGRILVTADPPSVIPIGLVDAILEKPWSGPKLLETVRRCVNGRASSESA